MPALALANLWKPLTIAALIAGLVAYRALLVHQRNAALGQVKSLELQAEALQADNAALKGAVAQQNAAVDELRQQAAAAASAAQQRETAFARKAQTEMQAASQRARAISDAAVPPDCEGAIKWGNAQGPQLGQW